jgi:8-oxo-dGTP pyrophosphatase MutT (NUDIX family)
MVRRGDDGTWALPAGRLEPGESWLECASREFREETGLPVVITGLLGIYSEPATSRHTYPNGNQVQFVGVVFEGEVEGLPPPVAAGGEITAVEYFAPSALPVPIFAPSRIVIEDALSKQPRPVVR